MKIVIIFLLFSGSLLASNSFDKNWKILRDNERNKIWKAKGHSKIMASSYIKNASKYANSQLLFDKAFFKELIAKKKKMLAMVGVTNWTVKNHQWISKSQTPILKIEGTYKDNQDQIVSFVEIQRFSKIKTTHLLYTWPSSIGPINKQLSESFFDHFMVK